MLPDGHRPPGLLTRRLNRRRLLQQSALLSTGLLAWLACTKAEGQAPDTSTTLDRTILLDGDGGMREGPGEPYVVRTELAAANASRASKRRSLLAFHHLSDFRIVDEESPLRNEWLESCPSPLSTSAFRPQESLSLQAASALIARANAVSKSPVTGRAVDLAIHTGNAADNAQQNEVRAFIDLMDGGMVKPASGSAGYQGVQGESPDAQFPNLLLEAQAQFQAVPLAYPWYGCVGNRDVLVGGTLPTSSAARTVAMSDRKVVALGLESERDLCADPSLMLDPETTKELIEDPYTVALSVTPDRGRKLLDKAGFMREHLQTAQTPGPSGHGFTLEGDARTYYAIDHEAVSVLVLDTVNPAGFSGGSIDAAQLAWLEEALVARSSRFFGTNGRLTTTANADRVIVIASHHPVSDMTNTTTDPSGEARYGGAHLRALLQRFPNVVLHVAGHRAQNRISALGAPVRAGSGAQGEYWEVVTGSPLDWPMQGRLLEIVDNGDGTLSIFSTMYDADAPIVPDAAKDPTPEDGVNQALLASVARRLALGDPQADRDAAGLAPSDRNAELLIAAPFALP